MDKTTIDQSGARAEGSIVAGNQQNIYNYGMQNRTRFDVLFTRLQVEVDSAEKTLERIDDLQRYYENRPTDEVVGLEAKLRRANMTDVISYALEKKEYYAKFMEKWSMYATAQRIFVCLLAKIEHEYAIRVVPHLDSISSEELNNIMSRHIIEPILEDCGATMFYINHGHVDGMIYWLAEQCYVRWHK